MPICSMDRLTSLCNPPRPWWTAEVLIMFSILVTAKHWRRMSGHPCCDRFQCQPAAALVQHLSGSRCPNSSDADGPHSEQCVQIAHATRCLDLNPGRAVLAHQLEIFHGRAGRGITSRCLCPIHAKLAADLTETDLLLVIEICILKDDLDPCPFGVGQVGQRAELFGHIEPVATANLADVDNGVQLP